MDPELTKCFIWTDHFFAIFWSKATLILFVFGFHRISMGESNTVVSAYTLYRHLQQYFSHPMIWLCLYLGFILVYFACIWVSFWLILLVFWFHTVWFCLYLGFIPFDFVCNWVSYHLILFLFGFHTISFCLYMYLGLIPFDFVFIWVSYHFILFVHVFGFNTIWFCFYLGFIPFDFDCTQLRTINSLSHNPYFLTYPRSKPFENIVEKEKMLLTEINICVTFILSSANAFNFVTYKILLFCKELRKQTYFSLALSQTTNFRLVQIERGCRRQF